MPEQLVRLVLCGLAIIPRDRDIQAWRKQVSLQLADFLFGFFVDQRRIGAFALCQGDGHRRILTTQCIIGRSGSIGKQHVVVGFGGSVHDFCGHVAQVDGPRLIDSDNHLIQVVGFAQKSSGFDFKLLVVVSEASSSATRIGLLQLIR